ncbi:MAG: hypothetical protein HQK51_13590 [Oligoflexia bacterium]|nr:hypothetical protein [Oligoflexia bacterium]
MKEKSRERDVRKLNIFTQKLARSTSKILLTYFRNKIMILLKKKYKHVREKYYNYQWKISQSSCEVILIYNW